MAAFDVEARQDAWEELRPIAAGGNGQACLITRKSGGTASRNDATGVRTVAGAPTVNGCGMDEAFKAFMIDGERIRASDRRFWLAALDVAGAAFEMPIAGDTATIGSVAHQIVDVERYEPAGLVIWAYLHLRA